MPEWHLLYPGERAPSAEQIADYIQNPVWQALNHHLQRAYDTAPTVAYSGCSMQPGWNVKYKKSGKSLCTLYPMQGYFIALVAIGPKEMPEAELLILTCSAYTQALFADTKTWQGQKWLMIDVKDEDTAKDVIDLIALRVKPKRDTEA